eukprot:gene9662-biopygen8288
MRGTLHFHFFVWLIMQSGLDTLANTLDDAFFGPDGMRARLLRYIEMSGQESVALLPAKLGVPSLGAAATSRWY